MRRRSLFPLLSLALALAAPVLARASATDHPRVRMETSRGTIVLELDAEHAPKTVANFLGYVRDGFYDGLIFHRVIDGFMIQGGGFDQEMHRRTTRPPIQNESANGLHNARGTIAMARTPAPHSATAQFFINLVDNDRLDRDRAGDGWGYCVFGHVVSGMDVVDAIAKVPTTTRGPMRDVPREPVVITRASVITDPSKE